MSTASCLCLVLYHLWVCLLSNTNAVGTGTVRLYRNGVGDTTQSWTSGIVQIYYNEWGNICDDGFGYDEADVICHQLGYAIAISYSNTGETTRYGDDPSPSVITDVSCSSSSSYLTITQCTFSTLLSCPDSSDVVVSCEDSTRIWDSPLPGDIRLTGGTYSNQGLLEVYCNGEWGTVSNDNFFDTQAMVACRQLGYNDVEGYDHLSFQINNSQSIWLTIQTSCTTADTCLTSCGTCPLTSLTFSSHNEDVTLECGYSSSSDKERTETKLTSTCYDKEPAPVGTVRLFRNGVPDTTQSWSSGIVQIYYNGEWGSICDDGNFGSDEADVICHQLGYTGASSYSNTGLATNKWGTDTLSTLITHVSCSSSLYLTITQCIFLDYNVSSSSPVCNDENDVTVTCFVEKLHNYAPSPGDIRLTGGKYSNQGLLEVYCNGEWGTVCDNSFSQTEAIIACRQLGYNYYNSQSLLLRGNSSQPIWLNTVTSCSSSTDTCLTSCGACPSSPITSGNCNHLQNDVTLVCGYNVKLSKINTTLIGSCVYPPPAQGMDPLTLAVGKLSRSSTTDFTQTTSWTYSDTNANTMPINISTEMSNSPTNRMSTNMPSTSNISTNTPTNIPTSTLTSIPTNTTTTSRLTHSTLPRIHASTVISTASISLDIPTNATSSSSISLTHVGAVISSLMGLTVCSVLLIVMVICVKVRVKSATKPTSIPQRNGRPLPTLPISTDTNGVEPSQQVPLLSRMCSDSFDSGAIYTYIDDPTSGLISNEDVVESSHMELASDTSPAYPSDDITDDTQLVNDDCTDSEVTQMVTSSPSPHLVHNHQSTLSEVNDNPDTHTSPTHSDNTSAEVHPTSLLINDLLIATNATINNSLIKLSITQNPAYIAQTNRPVSQETQIDLSSMEQINDDQYSTTKLHMTINPAYSVPTTPTPPPVSTDDVLIISNPAYSKDLRSHLEDEEDPVIIGPNDGHIY